jgi:hypothetical protein
MKMKCEFTVILEQLGWNRHTTYTALLVELAMWVYIKIVGRSHVIFPFL